MRLHYYRMNKPKLWKHTRGTIRIHYFNIWMILHPLKVAPYTYSYFDVFPIAFMRMHYYSMNKSKLLRHSRWSIRMQYFIIWSCFLDDFTSAERNMISRIIFPRPFLFVSVVKHPFSQSSTLNSFNIKNFSLQVMYTWEPILVEFEFTHRIVKIYKLFPRDRNLNLAVIKWTPSEFGLIAIPSMGELQFVNDRLSVVFVH